MQPLIDIIPNVIGKQENGAKKTPKNNKTPKLKLKPQNPQN